MKLDKLWIDGFKNLEKFSVDFDENNLFTVLIGWNGTGKSNLFEALVIIFRDLDYNQRTPFAYELEYICHGKRIKITNKPNEKKPQDRLKKEWKPLKGKEDYKTIKTGEDYLPSFVFGYYSGPSDRLKEPFLDPQRDYYNKILNIEKYSGEEDELRKLRRFFYAEQQHSKYVLLAFFLKRDDEIDSFLKKYFRIIGLDSVLFIMKKPSWTSKEGDPRFWNARGLVQRFLDRLYSTALAPMRLSMNLPTGITARTKQELLYLYIKDTNALSKLADDFTSPTDFFASLESTDLSEVVHDVNIGLKMRDGSILNFRDLSEGEQQLLMVLGLLRFTKQKESLILLDEPDTHLNPFWSTEYIDILKKYVYGEREATPDSERGSRHIIMSTHDPLVIAGLEKEQIQILKRDDETDHCYAETPERSPQGMGFEGILTSDMFGFRSALDKPTLALLDEKRRLAAKENLTEKELRRLEELNEKIGDLDFTNVVRDEYYKIFVREMAKYEEEHDIHGQVLTPEQFAARQEHAHKLVAEIATQIKQKKL